jgi:hypothetical protein
MPCDVLAKRLANISQVYTQRVSAYCNELSYSHCSSTDRATGIHATLRNSHNLDFR